jgi:uncharacterized protein (TIGR01777 family)
MYMRILLTGGHGFIGLNLLPLLDKAGHELVLLARNVPRARETLASSPSIKRVSGLLSRVKCIQWNPAESVLSDDAELAFASAEAVIHLAGENIGRGRWSDARKREIRQSRVDATQQIGAALGPVTRIFMSASAVGIYPQTETNAAESYFPVQSQIHRLFLEQLVIDWEQAAMAAQQIGRRVIRLRTGIVLGNQGFLAELAPLYRLGLGGPIGNGQQMIPWIHVADHVRAIAWIIAHEQLDGAVNLVGPQPIAFAELSALLAKQLHRPHFMRVPEALLRVALGEKSQLALSSCSALPQKLLESGFAFEFSDCESAIRNALSNDHYSV